MIFFSSKNREFVIRYSFFEKWRKFATKKEEEENNIECHQIGSLIYGLPTKNTII